LKQNGAENGMMKSRIMIATLSSVMKGRIIARSRLVARIVETRKSQVIFIGNSKKKKKKDIAFGMWAEITV